ncbi:hypothetical protein [Picosynechococcus sp. NKBG15041c]|uniref:hypothetical protein n=1 Tax=Picosynechococcus sp. NKBG15041c TaxID=1407650 RepID=UPI00191C5DBF|nr:hypothetical protein [Picosynechococcus sp. NKBG15041c]
MAITLSFIMESNVFDWNFNKMAAVLPFAGYIIVFTGVALGGFLGLRAANII